MNVSEITTNFWRFFHEKCLGYSKQKPCYCMTLTGVCVVVKHLQSRCRRLKVVLYLWIIIIIIIIIISISISINYAKEVMFVSKLLQKFSQLFYFIFIFFGVDRRWYRLIGVNLSPTLWESKVPPFPSLPFHSPPFPSPPLRSRPLNPARGFGECCNLPQLGFGRSPSRQRFWCILRVKVLVAFKMHGLKHHIAF